MTIKINQRKKLYRLLPLTRKQNFKEQKNYRGVKGNHPFALSQPPTDFQPSHITDMTLQTTIRFPEQKKYSISHF
ncbi:uncharacterized protein METZ01_LOCUS491119 [marine metagenome]|uniref:Uncharacterized protein n=1 Tax=marine metagenome TaxID=408172 RepID=A0A383D1Y9_9ZZZZ